jgi:hypothetical protein
VVTVSDGKDDVQQEFNIIVLWFNKVWQGTVLCHT